MADIFKSLKETETKLKAIPAGESALPVMPSTSARHVNVPISSQEESKNLDDENLAR